MIFRGRGSDKSPGLGGRHSRRVDRLRFILPTMALMILVLIMAWPWLNGGYHGIIMPVLSRAAGLDTDAMRMHQPRYVGRTKEQEPYEVSAESAFLDPKNQDKIHLDRITAVVEQRTAENVHVRANEGLFYRSRGTLDLRGDLELRVGERYTFNTSEASVNFRAGEMVGPMPVTGKGPIGTLAADRFNVSNHGKLLRFKGRVQVVYQPDAPSF